MSHLSDEATRLLIELEKLKPLGLEGILLRSALPTLRSAIPELDRNPELREKLKGIIERLYLAMMEDVNADRDALASTPNA